MNKAQASLIAKIFQLFVVLVCIISLYPRVSHAAAVGNEVHNFGAACTGNGNGADWDTVFQCKNSTWQRAPYFFGTSADACDAAHAGIVQWSGTTLQVCNGTAWTAVGSSSAGLTGQSIYSGFPDAIACLTTTSAGVSYTQIFYLLAKDTTNNIIYYKNILNSNGDSVLGYNISTGGSAGGSSYTGWTSLDCLSSAYSISTLNAMGRTFNFTNGGSSAGAMLDGTAGAPGLYFANDTNTGFYRPGSDALAIATSGAERLRVTATGSVGIGTTSPVTKLQVVGSSGTNQFWAGTANNGWEVATYDGGNNYLLSVGSSGVPAVVGTQNNQPLYFFTNNTFAATILANGNVGIGTTAPVAPLEVNGAVVASNNSGVTIWGQTTISDGHGAGGYNIATGCYGTLGFGSYSINGNCGTNLASDKRLKKDIIPVKNGLNVVMKLRPVSYFWKNDRKNHDLQTNKEKKAYNYGFIAQDVMNVLPDLVTEFPSEAVPFQKTSSTKSESYYGLDYNGFIAPMVAAVQELNQMVEKLKADNDNLRSTVKAQEIRLQKLEARLK